MAKWLRRFRGLRTPSDFPIEAFPPADSRDLLEVLHRRRCKGMLQSARLVRSITTAFQLVDELKRRAETRLGHTALPQDRREHATIRKSDSHVLGPQPE